MVRYRPMFWVFAGLSLLIGVISLRSLALPLAEAMPHMAHYVPTLPGPLWFHLTLGPLALLLAPVQLWTGLRQRRPWLHRLTGYTYALAVLGAGIASLLLLPQFQGTSWAASGFAAMALVWIACTATGVIYARKGDTATHRVWMLRSIAVAFGAVTLRLYMAPLIANGWTVTETYDVTAWLSWVPNLIAVQLWLNRRGFQAA